MGATRKARSPPTGASRARHPRTLNGPCLHDTIQTHPRTIGPELAKTMTLDELARQQIDRQLVQCGWRVLERNELNLSVTLRISVRGFPMLNSEADYTRYACGKVIGIDGSKTKEYSLKEVDAQSNNCVRVLAPNISACVRPLPFVFEPTQALSRFFNLLDANARNRKALPSTDRTKCCALYLGEG